MAKKTKSFSHIEAQDALENLSNSPISGSELIYKLLSIFCGYGEGVIRRMKENVGAKKTQIDDRTTLVPSIVAYRVKGNIDFYTEIKAMQSDIRIIKQKPRLYIVSDGKYIVAADPKEQDIYENEVSLMWKDFEFFYPLAGIEKFRNVEEAEADVKSAELMAKLFDEIRRHNDIKDEKEMHNLNVFMSRLLFCYFAEDTKLFPEEHLFTNAISKYTAEDGHDLVEFIDRAFLAMSTNNKKVLDTLPSLYSIFPYVNGGLFEKRLPIPVLSRRARVLMIKCGDYNWAEINPDIFGSMIQAVVSPEMRAGLGMHYTSVPNIMKLIRPLFLDALYEDFTIAKETKSVKKFKELLYRLSKIKFFDPACGSGNFLIVTYKCIRELEILIWQELRELDAAELPLSYINLQQFYGIELDDFACDTAKLSLWLAEHQMNLKFETAFGTMPKELPLNPSGHIVCGNSCRLDWNTVCPHTSDEEVYIMGNPPYLGSSMQDDNQKADLEFVCGGFPNYKNLDYIASWFYKGACYIKDSRSKCAFVSTNSICQGDSVALLWPEVWAQKVEIDFAYKSFKWSNNAKANAAVIVVIIGLANMSKSVKKLISGAEIRKCNNINPYLLEGENVCVPRTGKPLCDIPEMIRGSMPSDGGGLILNPDEYEILASVCPESISPLKRYMGAEDFINDVKRYCIWTNKEEYEVLDNIPEFHNRFEIVKQSRLKSDTVTTSQYAKYPYLFRQPQYKPTDSILVPRVSSERRMYIPMGFIDKDTIVSDAAFAVYDATMWMFAILTSRMHMVWVKTVAGRLKSDYRYSAQICYNTFPIPNLRDIQKEELSCVAQNILDIRDQHFDMTLGEMYNPETMPEDLKEAHHKLDLAVERCYRLNPFASDEERLEHLFKLYIKMTKK